MINKRLHISDMFIKRAIMDWWACIGKPDLELELTTLRQNTGLVQRIDITHKFTSKLTAKDIERKRMMPVRAYLLLVLNEYGQIIGRKMLPNQEHISIEGLLTEIWKTPNCVVPGAIYTDNVRKDHEFLRKIFKNVYPAVNFLPIILQDQWHCIQRVLRVMDSNAINYKKASNELRCIFEDLTSYVAYNSVTDFNNQLDNWCYKWENIKTPTNLSSSEVLTLANKELNGLIKFLRV